jgi:hypothetical protein
MEEARLRSHEEGLSAPVQRLDIGGCDDAASVESWSSLVITGLVPVIPIYTAQEFKLSGWPGQARP